ncbi:hypothetical protein [Massilia glaciei]|uniref:Alpha-2-macroglobulin domain-containing protein n=1 Tax=Massilia glaciei TaxID=1524097 RepID=A0A2U2HNM2_9BURK|nr:hypothetical protein [Massilia glaciei]PWF49036.1 hypothetical protein C7C56_009140 [Massilia glaciei]
MPGLAKTLLLAGAIIGVPLQAAVDGAAAARGHAGGALLWENVSARSYLAAGAHAWRGANGIQTVELPARSDGRHLAIHVPAHAMLRVVAVGDGPGGPLEAPVFAVSDGTGLAVERTPLRGGDGRSWLLKTGLARPAVIHLWRQPAVAAARHATRHVAQHVAQHVELYLARAGQPPEPIAYRHQLHLPGEKVQVRRADRSTPQAFVRVPAGGEIVVPVAGLDRLQLAYRIDTSRTPATAVIAIDTRLDGRPARLLRQPTGPETVAPVSVDGAWRAVSRQELVALDIPAGAAQLRLRPSHDLLLRAAAARQPDFLLPGLNIPHAWRQAGGGAALEAAEQGAIAAAMSNGARDIGLLAGEKLRREAAASPGLGGIGGAADELAGQFTEYRNLAAADASDIDRRNVVLRSPQVPLEEPRSSIGDGDVLFAAPPAALFQPIGAKALRFALPDVPYPVRIRALVPAGAGAMRIEVLHADGSGTTLISGVPMLGNQDLRPAAAGLALVPGDAWPPTMGGHADRNGGTAPLIDVASTEWEVPRNVRSLTLRASGGVVPVALQWAGGTEYFLDDEVLARLAQGAVADPAGLALQQAALRPLQRMLAAARAQFVANAEPPAAVRAHNRSPREGAGTSAREAEREAEREADPVRAVALWQSALQTGDAARRARALRGLVRALLAAGERFTAERLLRSHWIGADPALAGAAQTGLEALYAREGDADMQRLFTAARAARDPNAYAPLSALLAADGDDRMALLAGLAVARRDMPALLASALRSRRWKTFDALLRQLGATPEAAFWRAQRALSFRQMEQARRGFMQAGQGAWSDAAGSGRDIAAALLGTPAQRAAAVPAWLAWQAGHPGARLWRDEPGALVRHGGSVGIRSVALNLRSSWWRASAAQPLVARVVGPVRILVEARPLHQGDGMLLDGTLRVQAPGQLWVQSFHQNRASPGLEIDASAARPGAAVAREIALPAGVHELAIDAGAVPVLARLRIARPALQIPVLAAPTSAHFMAHDGVAGSLAPAPRCGSDVGCHIVANGALAAYRVGLAPLHWQALPRPAAARDPVAGFLAAGDVDAALEHASDPAERMRLLLWMADNDPARRARAVALGAALANRHPVPEVLDQWERLAASSAWVWQRLVDRSAGLRPVPAPHGAPESPAARIRAALLPALREGELRIGGDTRASLLFDGAAAGSVGVELTMDDLPGAGSLPVTALIERNGKPLRALRLDQGRRGASLTLPVPPGRQRISVALQTPYINQFLRVRFGGAQAPDPEVTRDWHIASASEPVKASFAGPAWVRIDRLERDGVRSEERLLAGPVATLVLPPAAGEAESLYRLHARQPDPVAAAMLPPRPGRYRPQPVPDAPPAWQMPAETRAARVRFVDGEPPGHQRDGTLSARLQLMRGEDGEARGAGAAAPGGHAEAGLTWRRRADDGQDGRLADVFVRQRPGAPPAVGFRLHAERERGWSPALPWPFTLSATLSGAAQDTAQGFGAAVALGVAASQRRVLAGSGLWSHEPTVRVAARALNLDLGEADAARVDSDVHTRYRAQHKLGISLGDTLSWRPWRDTHLSAALSLTTNPDLNILRPDHVRAAVQWRQLIGPVIAEVGGRAIHYRADAKRADQATLGQLWLRATGEWWLRPGTRIEVRAEVRREIRTSETWGGIELRWHWGPGRELRDFGPDDIDFRAPRRWRAPAPPNRIEER